LSRIVYRVRQFAHYLRGARPGPTEQALVQTHLGPRLAELFGRMSPGEQAHSLRVALALLARGESAPALLIAALLHDVGKTRAPVSLPGRVLVVLAGRFAPGWAARLGQHSAGAGWLARPFVTAHQHAAWGADLAAEAGAPALAVALIRRHQAALAAPPHTEEDRLLAALRAADEAN